MKKKKHIVLKVLLSVLVLLLLAVGIAAATHPDLVKGAYHLLKTAPGNNVKAAWIFLTGNSESIKKQIDDNDANYSDAVKKIAEELSGTGLDLSQYTLDILASGDYSEEEMIRILMGKETAGETSNPEETKSDSSETTVVPSDEKKEESGGKKNETDGKTPQKDSSVPVKDEKDENKPVGTDGTGSDTTSTTDTPVSETKEETQNSDAMSEEVAACIAKLYMLKSSFTGQLSELEKTIRSTYVALPKEEQVPASRKSIAGQYIKEVARLELECDAQVEAALTDLRDTLVAQGKDTAVVETLRQAYENEKSLKKAYYLDVYMNGI